MAARHRVTRCFSDARKDEDKGKKHKGLLFTGIDERKAEEYVQKAKMNLELCELYKKRRLDYKIPEEWFYTLYYCALAILAKFGVESRSQRCTALFLRYVKENSLITYDEDFIDRITVYREKSARSDIDERENARYSSSVRSEEVIHRYHQMTDVCRRCISKCEEIIYSNKRFALPKELRELI